MQKLRCVAIDDEPLALDLMKRYILKFPSLELLSVFEDAISGAEFLRKHAVDLLFLDIDMPDINGIELVQSLEVRPMIIFTTAYKNFAYDGYELDALDYVLKPIDMERFSKTVSKAHDYYEYKQNQKSVSSDSLYVHSEYKLIRIVLSDILYIESFEDYITIHQRNEKPVTSLMTLKKVMEKLPEKDFKRVHRSYIVPVAEVQSVHNRKIKLRSGTEIPIGDSYVQTIQDWIK